MVHHVEDLIREEIREARRSPLKLEILAELYHADAIQAYHLGFKWRVKVYQKAYREVRAIENELYAKFPPFKFST